MNKPVIKGLAIVALIVSTLFVGEEKPASAAERAADLPGSISGRVLDQNAQVITDAPISICAEGIDVIQSAEVDVSQTDGSYQITGLQPGNYRITANCQRADNYETKYYKDVYAWGNAASVAVEAETDTADIDFTLGPGGRISGHVYRADGVTPVAGACVDLSSSNLTWTQIAGWRSTGLDGAFEFGGIPVGTAYVHVNPNCDGANPDLIDEWYKTGDSTPVGSQASAVTIAVGETTSDIEFQLDEGGSISGTLLKTGGTVITDVLISVRAEGISAGTGNYEEFVSQTDGSYSLTRLPPGDYKVMGNNYRANGYDARYYNNHYRWDQADLVTVTAGMDVADINFTLGEGGAISGHIYRADGVTPVSGACIDLSRSNQTWTQLAGWGTTGADGAFEFGGIPVGTAYIFVNPNCNWENPDLINEWYKAGGSTPDSSQASAVTITAGVMINNIDFQLDEGGSISGVVLKTGGSVISDAVISVRAEGVSAGTSSAEATISPTDGSFAITRLAAGSYKVMANNGRVNGYEAKYYNNQLKWDKADLVTVTAGANAAGVNFSLGSGGAISGHVYQADGVTPLSGVCIDLSSSNKIWNQITSWSSTDETGAFEFGGIPVGVAYIHANPVCEGKNPSFIDEWYRAGGASTPIAAQATPLTITAGKTISGIDFQLTGNWPLNLKPPDGALLKTGATKLKMTWKIPESQKAKNIKNYEVQLASDAAFTNIVAARTVKAANWTYAGLLPNTRYYWQVRAIFKAAPATGAWSTVNQLTSFTTRMTRPPTLKAPGNNSTQLKAAVRLAWKKPTGCPKNTTYLLQYSTDPTFAAGVTEVSGLTATTYNLTTLPVSAAPGTTLYYWRVKAMDSAGTKEYSNWSAARSFKR
jgi:hypothetical protein